MITVLFQHNIQTIYRGIAQSNSSSPQSTHSTAHPFAVEWSRLHYGIEVNATTAKLFFDFTEAALDAAKDFDLVGVAGGVHDDTGREKFRTQVPSPMSHV
jgi:hypothetical protein